MYLYHTHYYELEHKNQMQQSLTNYMYALYDVRSVIANFNIMFFPLKNIILTISLPTQTRTNSIYFILFAVPSKNLVQTIKAH